MFQSGRRCGALAGLIGIVYAVGLHRTAKALLASVKVVLVLLAN